ncbi:MAG: hypothetical protein F6K22_14995 [Okeania sp. SIO2F4]|uniref:hypothetical protein n=1 Tax=Okeania sp. SIO2F4 TaxID=2607790 RepID=UPI001428E6E1|nr:hypothetical protein [Okeania sp. SIO2F4]NES04026.1 hypothetical protein [Okeania sp. SIO2F4]
MLGFIPQPNLQNIMEYRRAKTPGATYFFTSEPNTNPDNQARNRLSIMKSNPTKTYYVGFHSSTQPTKYYGISSGKNTRSNLFFHKRTQHKPR